MASRRTRTLRLQELASLLALEQTLARFVL
jgi:hypothetical protein